MREKTTSAPATDQVCVRIAGSLGADARAAAANHVGGLSGLIREGLALRLYGNRTRRRSALLTSSRAIRA